MTELLSGRRILVAEDEFLAALEMKEMVEERGGAVVGPVGRLVEVREVARSEQLDAVVLDVSFDGEKSFEVADDLIARGVPVIFVTGYSADILPERFAATQKVDKPATRRALEAAFRAVLPDL